MASPAQHVGELVGLDQDQHSGRGRKVHRVSCAGFAGWFTVVGLGAKGASSNLWHTIRKSDGSQQTAVANIKDPGHDRSFTAVSCATVGNDVHVLGVHGGDIWHTVRYVSRKWKSWGIPPGQGDQADFISVAGAGVR